MGSNSFLQWNPGAANQETDAAYAADTQRTGGAAAPSLFSSVLANKLFFQLSTMVAALAQVMANAGQTVSDANLSNLEAAITATFPLLSQLAGTTNPSGYQKFPSGLILQWGLASNVPSDTQSAYSVTFAEAFPGNFLVGGAWWTMPTLQGLPQVPIGIVAAGKTTMTLEWGTVPGSKYNAFWIALGY